MKRKNKLLIIIIAILLILGVNIISNISYSKKQPEITTLINNKFKTSYNNIGAYISSNQELFIFLDNNEFYWFINYQDLNKNYYQGTYNYKKGPSVLEELGYSELEFKEKYGTNINIDEVYSFNIFYTQPTNQIDDIYPNDSWWFIIIKQDADNAIAINRTIETNYNLTKIN